MIEFPDLVQAAIPFLSSRLAARGLSAPVSHQVPAQRPASLVVLSIAGGARLDLIHRQSRLLVECWAPGSPAAQKLADACAAELEQATCRSQSPLAPGVWVSATPEDFSVPVNNPDPLSSSPRFQFYANLVLTGSDT